MFYGVWGVAPMRVVSCWCRCVVQRLCATDCKHPCLVRAAAPQSARHGRRACMPKCSMQGRIQVVEQSRCRTHRQQTTTIAQMQSQLSIHSPSPRGKGQSVEKPLSLSKNGVWGVAPRQVAGTPVPVFTPFPGERGFRQGCRNKDTPSFAGRKAIRVS